MSRAICVCFTAGFLFSFTVLPSFLHGQLLWLSVCLSLSLSLSLSPSLSLPLSLSLPSPSLCLAHWRWMALSIDTLQPLVVTVVFSRITTVVFTTYSKHVLRLPCPTRNVAGPDISQTATIFMRQSLTWHTDLGKVAWQVRLVALAVHAPVTEGDGIQGMLFT